MGGAPSLRTTIPGRLSKGFPAVGDQGQRGFANSIWSLKRWIPQWAVCEVTQWVGHWRRGVVVLPRRQSEHQTQSQELGSSRLCGRGSGPDV